MIIMLYHYLFVCDCVEKRVLESNVVQFTLNRTQKCCLSTVSLTDSITDTFFKQGNFRKSKYFVVDNFGQ